MVGDCYWSNLGHVLYLPQESSSSAQPGNLRPWSCWSSLSTITLNWVISQELARTSCISVLHPISTHLICCPESGTPWEATWKWRHWTVVPLSSACTMHTCGNGLYLLHNKTTISIRCLTDNGETLKGLNTLASGVQPSFEVQFISECSFCGTAGRLQQVRRHHSSVWWGGHFTERALMPVKSYGRPVTLADTRSTPSLTVIAHVLLYLGPVCLPCI